MKYFAILKDSLREALDSKILYVLFALTALVILFVASLSFNPLTAERAMASFFSQHPHEPPSIFAALNKRKPEKWIAKTFNWSSYRLEKVELIRGEPDSPESDYVLTVSRPGAKDANGEDVEATKRAATELRKLFQDAHELDLINLGDIVRVAPVGAQPGHTFFSVTVQGTASTHRIWATEPSLLFGAFPLEFFAAPLSTLIYNLASTVLGMGAWAAVLIGVVITSFFIPNMLRKGTIDLLLVKPIQRPVLLTYKYLGGLTFIFLSTAFAVGGIWFVLGIRSGLWANGALLLIFTITFFFAILYAVSSFVGVLTRSVVTTIMVTVGAWFVFFLVGTVHDAFQTVDRIEKEMAKFGKEKPEDERWGDGRTARIVAIVHAVMPRTTDLNHLNDLIIYTDFMTGRLAGMEKFDNSKRNWWECLLVSGVWIGIFLGSASLWFSYKDY